MSYSEMEQNALVRLGELLYRCQRIEWEMKRLLEKICFKREFANVKEIPDSFSADEKWHEDMSTMGNMCKRYLEFLFGDAKEASFTSGKIGLQINFQLDKNLYASRQACLEKLVDVRNKLAHHFGLDYDLKDSKSCEKALDFLKKSDNMITAAENALQSDKNIIHQIARDSAAAMAGLFKEAPKTAPSLSEYIESLGFSKDESFALVKTLETFEAGKWHVCSAFGSQLHQQVKDFQFKGHSVCKQGVFFERIASKGFVGYKKEGGRDLFMRKK